MVLWFHLHYQNLVYKHFRFGLLFAKDGLLISFNSKSKNQLTWTKVNLKLLKIGKNLIDFKASSTNI